MYQFEDGKSVFILIWNICISKPAAIYPFLKKMYCMSPPQASSYPGSGNGRPGIHPPSHPPHCAKPEESGPLILRYNTHFSTDQWTAGGVLFISLCLLCVSPAFAEFSFTCLVGLTNALEQDGFISGFMGFYVKKVRGGPALNLPPPPLV